AAWRGDERTAAALLERGLSLTRPFRLDLRLELDLVDALYWTDLARGVEVAEAAVERAEIAGDEVDIALARTVFAAARLNYDRGSADEIERLGHQALPLLEAAGDDDGIARVWVGLAWAANMRQQ